MLFDRQGSRRDRSERRGQTAARRRRGTVQPSLDHLEPRQLLTGILSGQVFQDFDGDGLFDVGTTITNDGDGVVEVAQDVGIPGVTVSVFESGGLPIATVTTDAGGLWSVNTVGTVGPYRVEFTGLPEGFFSGPLGPVGAAAGSGSTVQFVPDGDVDNINLGLVVPLEFVQDNPLLATSVYVFGDQINGSFNSEDVLISFPFSAGSDNSDLDDTDFDQPTDNAISVPADQIGPTWGLGWDRFDRMLYAGAFMKKHSGFGPGGPGTIYEIDVDAALADEDDLDPAEVFVNLNILFGDEVAGIDPHNTADFLLDNGNVAWDAVGKTAFGGLDVSEDGSVLYALALGNRTLFEIPLDGSEPPTADEIRSVPVPLDPPGATDPDDIRPFAVTVFDGLIYVGMVNTAESTQNADDLIAYVFTVDPETLVFSDAPVLQVPLNYDRGSVVIPENDDPALSADWLPWSPVFANVNTATESDTPLVYPQPWLTGIAFDGTDMIIGIRDRAGDQGGNQVPSNPDTPDVNFGIISGGDMLRAEGSPETGWTIEDNASSGGVTTDGQDNGQGPGGGEFYFEDDFPQSDPDGDPVVTENDEVLIGGITTLPGFPQVLSTAFNPTPLDGETEDGGVRWFSNADGEVIKSYRIFNGINDVDRDPGEDPTDPFFANGAGLGDLVVLADAAPIEIGNRVFQDTNGNGIQDPDEPGIPSVGLDLIQPGPDNLFDTDDDLLLASTFTSADGTFVFNDGTDGDPDIDLTPNTTFRIRVFTSIEELDGLTLTAPNQGTGPNADLIDSDAVAIDSSVIAIDLVTGSNGESNHSFDIGFVPLDDPATADPTGTLDGNVYVDINHNGVLDGPDFGIAGVSIGLAGITPDGDLITASTTTDAFGNYVFTDLPAGTYQISESQPDGFLDFFDRAGTLEGIAGNDLITEIVLDPAAGADLGVSYNFGELAPHPTLPAFALRTGERVANLQFRQTFDRARFNTRFPSAAPFITRGELPQFPGTPFSARRLLDVVPTIGTRRVDFRRTASPSSLDTNQETATAFLALRFGLLDIARDDD